MAKQATKKKAPAKKKAPTEKPEPAEQEQAVEQEESIETIFEGCQRFFADAAGVASGPQYVVLTLYQTVPDPRLERSPRAPVRFTNAIVTMPVVPALQIATLIRNQHMQNLNAEELPIQAVEAGIASLEQDLETLKSKLKEMQK